MRTHRGVVGGDINQDLRGAPAAHISVAVPHTANQVGLSPGGENKEHTQWPSATLSPLFIITLLWSHPSIKVRDDDGRDALYHYMIETHQLLVQRGRTGYTELRYFTVWTMSPFFRLLPTFSPRQLIRHLQPSVRLRLHLPLGFSELAE